MSATFTLYKVRPDVKWNMSEYSESFEGKTYKVFGENQRMSLCDLGKMYIPENEYNSEWNGKGDHELPEEFYDLMDKYTKDTFSEPGDFQVIRLDELRASVKISKRFRRIIRSLLKTGAVQTYTCKNGLKIRYVVAQEIGYRQGWFFKYSWGYGDYPSNMFFTARGAKDFMMKYFKLYEKRGIEAYNYFSNLWEAKKSTDVYMFHAAF